jgi:hypothetical protein
MMSEQYEITWRFECSSDEAALKMAEVMESTSAMVRSILPGPQWPAPEIHLVKVMK